LKRAIESSVNQHGDDYEVIVIDDGSTDNPHSVVSEYLDNPSYFNLRYYSQTNKGVSATRNRGIELSKGRFLIFLDADDELVEDALSHLRPLIEAAPDTGLFVGGHCTVFEDGTLKSHAAKAISNDREKNFYNFLKKKISMANGAVVVTVKFLIKYNSQRIFHKLKISRFLDKYLLIMIAILSLILWFEYIAMIIVDVKMLH
jgi:glycosyltransferase involved in cell wall biosynthesis